MTTTTVQSGERIAAGARPVARWVPETGPDGRTRLVMTWSVPRPLVPAQAAAA